MNIKWSLYVPLSFAVLDLLRSAHWLYLLTHTILEFSSVSLRLTRPLPTREWSGPLRAVRRAYFYRGLLAITTTDSIWDGWAVKVPPSDAPVVDELKRYLGPGVWLEDRQARIRLFRPFVVHAMLLVLALVAGRLVSHIQRALQ